MTTITITAKTITEVYSKVNAPHLIDREVKVVQEGSKYLVIRSS